jgi:hypothetical protein
MRRPNLTKGPVLQVGTPQLRKTVDGAYFLFCGEPQNRKGIDSLAQLCREKLDAASYN